jgi:putative acetyltransferase
LVDRIRAGCAEAVSLVAVAEGRVVGHIFFSPVTIESGERRIAGMGLAPMAVLPEYQRRGVGSRLANAGLEEIERAGHPFVIVLGHPEYYPRFGFVRASRYGVSSEYDAPDEAFMIRIFATEALARVRGVARYRPEFADTV